MTRNKKKVNGKQPGPEQQQPPPPVEEMATTTFGPAQRHIRVQHDKHVMSNTAENGIFWNCPGCKKRIEAWGQKLHNQVAVGNKIAMKCGVCGTWAAGSKSSVTAYTEGEANTVLAQLRARHGNN